jgi:hypothetical protein
VFKYNIPGLISNNVQCSNFSPSDWIQNESTPSNGPLTAILASVIVIIILASASYVIYLKLSIRRLSTTGDVAETETKTETVITERPGNSIVLPEYSSFSTEHYYEEVQYDLINSDKNGLSRADQSDYDIPRPIQEVDHLYSNEPFYVNFKPSRKIRMQT